MIDITKDPSAMPDLLSWIGPERPPLEMPARLVTIRARTVLIRASRWLTQDSRDNPNNARVNDEACDTIWAAMGQIRIP